MSAAESKVEKRSRVCGSKVKTGCITCKIRRVKCGEEKPHCLRCTSTGRKCDGYPSQAVTRTHTQSLISLPRSDSSLHCLAGNATEARYLEFYFHRIGPKLSGFLDSDLWLRLVLQFAFAEPAIRHATMAISYLYEKEIDDQCPGHPMLHSGTDESFFLQQYNKAINNLVIRMNDKPGSLVISLVTCMLFICLECLRRKDCSAALFHLNSGVNILAGLRNKRQLGPPSASLLHTTSDRSSRGAGDNTMGFLEENLVPVFARFSITAFLFGQDASPLYLLESMILANPPSSFASVQEARLSLVDLMNLSLMFVKLSTQKKHGNGMTQDDMVRFFQLKECMVRWLQAFENVEQSNPSAQSERKAFALLRMLHTTTWIWLLSCIFPTEAPYDEYLNGFHQIISLAEVVMGFSECQAVPKAQNDFSFEMEVVAPLYFTAVRCRDPLTRRKAIALLARYPRREALWEAGRCVTVAKRIMALEESGLQGMVGRSWPPERFRIHDAVFGANDSVFHVAFFSLPNGPGTPRYVWQEYLCT
ncbi:hypothetical protein AOQ84DRAFT_320449 [Glonium stellatum]|uniref:Zn(2)-C6 fungal-type domain-containing protein n=1 Tax=Glonium stellatum TaxID=574774 RepID=A0A8E2JRM0_9PEZI|nr:hypothetical protein AOQ84DRAFT_320449 [Glonium stellatum]